MRYLILCLLLFPIRALADNSIYLGNLNKYATGTSVEGKSALDVNVPGGITIDPSVFDPLAKETTLQDVKTGVLGVDTTLQGIDFATETTLSGLRSDFQARVPEGLTVSSNKLLVDIGSTDLSTESTLGDVKTAAQSIDSKLPSLDDGRIPVDGSGVTQPISATSLPLPSGAATSANQDTSNTSLSSIDGKLPDLYDGKIPVDASGSTVTATVSGTVDANVTASALPTGAATEANQDTGNTSLSSIDSKTPDLGQSTKSGSVPVTIASDQGNLFVNVAAISTSDLFKFYSPTTISTSSASISSSTTVSVPSAGSRPMFCIIQADIDNTDNIRWGFSASVSTTVGMVLAPGQDTGQITMNSGFSIVPVSGTQKYNVTWFY